MVYMIGWYCNRCHNFKSEITPADGTICGHTINNYSDEKLINAYSSEYPKNLVTDIKNISYETLSYLMAKYDLYNRRCIGVSYYYIGDLYEINTKNNKDKTLSDIYNDINRCMNN